MPRHADIVANSRPVIFDEISVKETGIGLEVLDLSIGQVEGPDPDEIADGQLATCEVAQAVAVLGDPIDAGDYRLTWGNPTCFSDAWKRDELPPLPPLPPEVLPAESPGSFKNTPPTRSPGPAPSPPSSSSAPGQSQPIGEPVRPLPRLAQEDRIDGFDQARIATVVIGLLRPISAWAVPQRSAAAFKMPGFHNHDLKCSEPQKSDRVPTLT